jgi:hypothetical protein
VLPSDVSRHCRRAGVGSPLSFFFFFFEGYGMWVLIH